MEALPENNLSKSRIMFPLSTYSRSVVISLYFKSSKRTANSRKLTGNRIGDFLSTRLGKYSMSYTSVDALAFVSFALFFDQG
ncbi:hypothetical protein CCACVL1_17099 [Corchorus capsularis]|uniref:Uncharacterized protein n=1 Tax=Corchorus capsularis TaxID=210143 RepID=A0A1R3HU09_COCAP|nr:hypothetical protein CCACVL1_17099 [Corchorus capsularis]